MRWTYWLMISSCLAFTANVVVLGADQSRGWEIGSPAATTSDLNSVAAVAAAEDLSWLLTPDDVERVLGAVPPRRLERNPFNDSALVPVGPFATDDRYRYDRSFNAPRLGPDRDRDMTSERTGAATSSTEATRRRARASQGETLGLDPQSRISRRLDRTESMFTETRFGALRERKTASRRSGRRTTRSGTIIRSNIR